MEYVHRPVLLSEAIDNLRIREDGIYVDATVGGGGHSYHILSRLTTGRLYCFDKDAAAIETSRTHLQTLSLNNFASIRSDFLFVKEELEKLGVSKVDGILFDLGVSSFQFDNPERGFSYRFDARLDMRMDETQALSAYEVVNNYDEQSLARLLFDYGEERYARSIARKIVETRKKNAIETTFQLVDVIKSAVPTSYLKDVHPAKKTFQALRIEVNGELKNLRVALEKALDLLNPGGRVCVISFHSLEDRIVKDVFRRRTEREKTNRFAPQSLHTPTIRYRLITKKPIVPSDEEIRLNRRAHSAKLRVIEKL